MNIDITLLGDIARKAYDHYQGGNKESFEAAARAVLAEVAKHNTPDKPAYFVVAVRPPTQQDANKSGFVEVGYYGGHQWMIASYEHAKVYEVWRPVDRPPSMSPLSEAAFSKVCDEVGGMSVRQQQYRAIWDAAIAHRDKSKS